jgi:hypothetical protein
MFSGSPITMQPSAMPSHYIGIEKSNMVDSKPEVHITQVLDCEASFVLKMKFFGKMNYEILQC